MDLLEGKRTSPDMMVVKATQMGNEMNEDVSTRRIPFSSARTNQAAPHSQKQNMQT